MKPICIAVVLLAASFSLMANAQTAPSSDASVDSGDGLGAQYCIDTGGQVEKRRPVYGSNGGSPFLLAGTKYFCRYTADDKSHIHISIQTLYTKQPTLAALAYYAAPELGSGCNGNPASCYCTQLGGSDQFGGTGGAGGGWFAKGEPDNNLEACIFPDMSTIDSWGLAYHSAGIIRGIDLSKVLRYPDPFKK